MTTCVLLACQPCYAMRATLLQLFIVARLFPLLRTMLRIECLFSPLALYACAVLH